MKRLTIASIAAVVLTGCALPVPRTDIAFNPSQRTLSIRSPKDVKFDRVELMVDGTNFTLTVDKYRSENNIEVVKAAVEAQLNQQKAGLEGFDKILSVATKAAP